MNLRCILAISQLLSAFYAAAYAIDMVAVTETETDVAPAAEDGLRLR